jgi:tryptophanyl-tRNA synthetase
MDTVFSGIQQSGELPLGNHLGAVRGWVSLLGTYECYFYLVDPHAVTQPYRVGDMSTRGRARTTITGVREKMGLTRLPLA